MDTGSKRRDGTGRTSPPAAVDLARAGVGLFAMTSMYRATPLGKAFEAALHEVIEEDRLPEYHFDYAFNHFDIETTALLAARLQSFDEAAKQKTKKRDGAKKERSTFEKDARIKVRAVLTFLSFPGALGLV